MSPPPTARLVISGRVVLLDARDAAAFAEHRWFLLHGIPYRRALGPDGRPTLLSMVRELARPGPGLVAHAPPVSPGGPIDLRRQRLAVLTRAECRRLAPKAAPATSRFRGVVYVPAKGRYRALVWHRGKVVHAGYFRAEADAAKARDRWALALFGRAAPLALNFPARPPAAALALRCRAGRRRRFHG